MKGLGSVGGIEDSDSIILRPVGGDWDPKNANQNITSAAPALRQSHRAVKCREHLSEVL